MGVSAAFLDSVQELFAALPDLRVKRMFGGAGVFSGELMFALVGEETLFIRADALNRAGFEAEGSTPFTYRMKDGAEAQLGYWRAPDAVWDDPDAAAHWARAGLEAAARYKAGKRKRSTTQAPALLISGPWDEVDAQNVRPRGRPARRR